MAMAQGLELLGSELLGRVLTLLAPHDLRASRLAARIFDEASRKHMERAATLKINPDCAPAPAGTGGARAGPSWARFPRLRRLVLGGWQPPHFADLRGILAGGGEGGLGVVEEVEVQYTCAPLDAPTWAAILRRTPRVAALGLGCPHEAWGADDALAALAAIVALAPHATRLDAFYWQLDAAAATSIAAYMPHLAALTLDSCWAAEGGPARQSELWAALPCTRLTELVVTARDSRQMLTCPPMEGAHWPRMRVLASVTLPAAHVAALARGLPGLQRLSMREWVGLDLPAGGAFKSLTGLELQSEVPSSFFRAAPLPRLFPALEWREWGAGRDNVAVECDVAGLSCLTRLKVDTIGRAVWDRIHLLSRL